MSSNKDLEKGLKEFEDMPAHILGITGWMLRSVPEDKRETFLKGYERLLRVVFFPDHSRSPDEKTQREKYIQAVSNAVSFLVADDFAYDLAIDNVSSDRNPVVRLKRDADQNRKQISWLENAVKAEKEKVMEVENQLGSQQEMNDSLVRIAAKDYDHFENNRVYLLRDLKDFSVRGRKIVLPSPQSCRKLFRVLFHAAGGYEGVHRAFRDEIESTFLPGKDKYFEFRNGKFVEGLKSVEIEGGLPMENLEEFVRYSFLRDGKYAHDLSPEDFKKYVQGLEFQGDSCSPERFAHRDLSRPFLRPFFYLNSPVLISTTTERPKKKGSEEASSKVKYDLFYVEGINPHKK